MERAEFVVETGSYVAYYLNEIHTSDVCSG